MCSLEIYERKPIDVVVFQLRFDPSLKLTERIPDFQESVLPKPLLYVERKSQHVDFSLLQNPSVNFLTEDVLVFRTKDTQSTLQLITKLISSVERAHKIWVQLSEFVYFEIKSLSDMMATISETRGGIK